MPKAPAPPIPEPPADDATVPDQPATPVEDSPVTWSTWQYNGPPGRVYTHIPLTVSAGDVIHWAGPPADDGSWRPAPAGSTAMAADNARPDPGVPSLTGNTAGLYEVAGGGVNG